MSLSYKAMRQFGIPLKESIGKWIVNPDYGTGNCVNCGAPVKIRSTSQRHAPFCEEPKCQAKKAERMKALVKKQRKKRKVPE